MEGAGADDLLVALADLVTGERADICAVMVRKKGEAYGSNSFVL